MQDANDSGIAIGTLLAGRYRIVGVLGAGGMGRVYRGEHAAIGKTVAVKVLHAAFGSSEEAAVRFQREAIAGGRLDHPNIVNVVDFGTLDDGALYLVMEALDGEHLGQRLAREKRIAWVDALLIARSVLLGLRHAHERGVVHRDIKPDNIFLASKNGEEIVKVLDFGIAKLYAESSDALNATRSGITVGTPTYLSPEQATGGAIKPATDIYSTSIVLYEMLVGRAPYESDDPLTLLTSHAGAEVPAFEELAPGLELPEAIEPLVRRGLTKISAERMDSTEYIEAIDEILRAHSVDVGRPALTARSTQSRPSVLATPTPLHVRAPTPTEPSRDPERAQPATRPRWRIVLGLALTAAVAAAALVAFLRWRSDGEAAASALRPPVTPPATTSPPPTSIDRDVERETALHQLQDGATCAERKKAIAQLVELGDAKVVPAIKKARARGKANACLRTAADAALKTLAGRT